MTQTQQHNVPALRFSEFSGEWVKKNLLELSKNGFSNGVFNDPRKVGFGYKLINVKDMYKGNEISLDDLSFLELSQKEFESNKVVRGDVFFTRSSLVKEGIAYSCVFLSDDEKTTYDGHLIRMSPDEKQVIPTYLGYALKTDASRKQLVARGKTTTMTTIGQNDISSVEMILGRPVEQQKIASFLSSVDRKIEQLSKKKNLLEQYKKGMTQKLFSQEMRFKDDQGNNFADWEEKRLGDVASVYQPETLSQSQLDDDGDYLVYGANGVIGRLNRFNHEEPQVAVTCRGNTCGQVTFTKPKSWITGNSMVVNLDNSKSVLKKYLYYDFKKTDWRYLITGSGQPQITGEIKKHKIKLPPASEQQKIATFLSTIDQKINLLATEIDKARTFKKGLLQQMFV